MTYTNVQPMELTRGVSLRDVVLVLALGVIASPLAFLALAAF